MRDYAKVSPAFWMKGSGKALRGHAGAQIVGLYLVTCPSANMIGLYYLPKELLVHETGLTEEGASEGLRRASEAGFAFYDEESELAWVPNGAIYQIGATLTGKDKRKAGVLRELCVFRKHPFAREFFDLYRVPYGLKEPEWLPPRQEAPSKPLRSQDQDHDQEQERKKEPATRVEEQPIAAQRPPRPTLAPTQRTIDPDLKLPAEARAMAEIAGVQDVDAAWQRFVGHHIAEGTLSCDFIAGNWRKWIPTARNFERLDRDRAARTPPGVVAAGPSPEVIAARTKASDEADSQRKAYKRIAVPPPTDELFAAIGGKR